MLPAETSTDTKKMLHLAFFPEYLSKQKETNERMQQQIKKLTSQEYTISKGRLYTKPDKK